MNFSSALATAKVDGALHLSFQGLCEVPAAVLTLADSLKRLDLGHNELTSLPAELGALHGLEELLLNGNDSLASLPAALAGCVSLRRLDVRGTALTTLPFELSRLPALVDIALDDTPLEAALLGAAQRGGTLALLGALARRDARATTLDALRKRLCLDVWKEAADTEAGRVRLDAVIADVDKAFPEDRDVRFAASNAARLFGPELGACSIADVIARFQELRDDVERKALGADIELAMRAHYYDAADPREISRIRIAIVAALPTLDDARFLIAHSRALFPARFDALEPSAVPARIVALRTRLAVDREAAVKSLVGALRSLYPERDVAEVEKLARATAALILKTEEIRALAGEVADFFPAEFGAAKAKKVFADFRESTDEKLGAQTAKK